MDMNNIIYAWLDQNGDPYYIGKTVCLKTRTRHHRWRMDSGINLPKYNKLRKLLREGFKWDIQILEDGIPETEWKTQECYWIKLYRDQGCKLYNLTDGGDGATLVSEESKRRWRESRKGYRHSEETKRKMSERRMGMKFSDEHKENLSKARQKRVTTDETRKKCSATSRGKINIGKFVCISPDGTEFFTERGLSEFCREHSLTVSLMTKVANGQRSHHKKWKCERLQ